LNRASLSSLGKTFSTRLDGTFIGRCWALGASKILAQPIGRSRTIFVREHVIYFIFDKKQLAEL
jgi:hypothetical protein